MASCLTNPSRHLFQFVLPPQLPKCHDEHPCFPPFPLPYFGWWLLRGQWADRTAGNHLQCRHYRTTVQDEKTFHRKGQYSGRKNEPKSGLWLCLIQFAARHCRHRTIFLTHAICGTFCNWQGKGREVKKVKRDNSEGFCWPNYCIIVGRRYRLNGV